MGSEKIDGSAPLAVTVGFHCSASRPSLGLDRAKLDIR
jgi:hypothetical protein